MLRPPPGWWLCDKQQKRLPQASLKHFSPGSLWPGLWPHPPQTSPSPHPGSLSFSLSCRASSGPQARSPFSSFARFQLRTLCPVCGRKAQLVEFSNKTSSPQPESHPRPQPQFPTKQWGPEARGTLAISRGDRGGRNSRQHVLFLGVSGPS